ncbi:MAG: glycosyltransferase family 4 protein [Desulfomonilaceae bacterium]
MNHWKAQSNRSPDQTRDADGQRPLTIGFMAVKGISLGGGIESVTERLGSRLAQRGHRVIVFSASQFGSKTGYYKGMEIRVCPSILQKHLHKITLFTSAMFPLLLKSAGRCLWAKLSGAGSSRCAELDILHIHEFSLFSLFPRVVGIPTIVQMHALLWKRAKWGPMSRLFLRMNDFTLGMFPSAVTCVSKTMKEHFEKTLGREVAYIPNGVEPPTPKAPQRIKSLGLNGNDYILFAARLVPEKGAHYLIEAFLKLDPPLKLVIAGDDPFEKDYIRTLRRLGQTSDKIIFPGYASGDEYLELITNAALFVLPSEIEGMPVALLEAMSYGKCCIVSDIPENVEALAGKGFVFANKSVDDLARVLRTAIQDEETAAALGQQGREYVLAEYSWDRIVGLYEEFYRRVIEQATRARAPR